MLLRTLAFGLVGILTWSASAPGADAGSLVVSPAHVHAAPVFQQATISSSFTVTNQGRHDVSGLRAVARSGLGSFANLPSRLAAGESAQFEYRYPVGAALGVSTQRLALFTDEPDVDRYRFTVTAFVLNAFEPEGAVLDFGSVDVRTRPRRTIEISSREAERWKMTGLESAPDFVEVELTDGAVAVELHPNAPPGPLTGDVVIRTDLAVQPLLVLPLRGFAIGRLLPEATGIGFLRVEVGQAEERSIAIRIRPGDSSERALAERLQIESEEGIAEARIAECPNEVRTCARLALRATPQTDGPFTGQVRVRLEGGDDEPATPIAYSGFAMLPGVEPRRIQVDDELAATTAGRGMLPPAPRDSAPPGAPASNIQAMTGTSPDKAASDLSAEPEGEGAGNDAQHPDAMPKGASDSSSSEDRSPTVRWKVSNEANVYGYSVYRSTDRGGRFVRIGEPVIPVASGDYEFTDTSAEPGKTYYYFVDAVSVRGQRVRLTPTLRKSTAGNERS